MFGCCFPVVSVLASFCEGSGTLWYFDIFVGVYIHGQLFALRGSVCSSVASVARCARTRTHANLAVFVYCVRRFSMGLWVFISFAFCDQLANAFPIPYCEYDTG